MYVSCYCTAREDGVCLDGGRMSCFGCLVDLVYGIVATL